MELEEPEKYKEILCLVFNYVMLPPILPAYLFPKQKEKTVAKNKLKLQVMNKSGQEQQYTIKHYCIPYK
jgi:hypothetical protein